MVTFVLGFAFNKKLTDVVLITKNHTDFLAGKLNGLSGKVKPTDCSFRVAMHREALKEGDLHADWRFGTSVRFGDDVCYVFYAVATNRQLLAIRTLTDEPAHIYQLSQLDELPIDIVTRSLIANTLQYAKQDDEIRWRANKAQKLQRRK